MEREANASADIDSANDEAFRESGMFPSAAAEGTQVAREGAQRRPVANASAPLLIASVGHELNNPLSYTLSNLESLAHALPKLAGAVERCRAALRNAVGNLGFAAIVGEGVELLESESLYGMTEQAHVALDGARRIAHISAALRAFSSLEPGDLAGVDIGGAFERAVASSTRHVASSGDDRAPPVLRGRILIVDDEELLRGTLRRLLDEHDVVTATSGSEAHALLEHDPNFDLILCDVMMPGMCGVDLHRRLVECNPALARRVVFISGGGFGQGIAEYVLLSGNLKIDKPFDNAVLRRVIAEQVRASKSEAPLPRP